MFGCSKLSKAFSTFSKTELAVGGATLGGAIGLAAYSRHNRNVRRANISQAVEESKKHPMFLMVHHAKPGVAPIEWPK